MTALNSTLFDDILKIHYTGPIVSLLENSTALANRLEKVENESGGKYSYIPIETVRASSIGARTDLTQESLPTGSPPQFDSATYEIKSLYATVTLSGRAMRASRNNTYAFAKAQQRDMESTMKATMKDLNRQLFGTADGELCVIVSQTGTPNVVTVTSNAYPTNPTKFITPGMLVDVRVRTTLADLSNGSGLTVDAANLTSTTFQYTGTAFTDATTQSVYRAGNCGAVSGGAGVKEINGLSAIISDKNPKSVWGTNYSGAPNLGGIDRTSVSKWQAQSVTNSGTLRPFSLSLIQTGIDASEINAGGSISLIQTNHAIRAVYGLMMAATKQADVKEMTLDGGFKYLNVNGIPMVWDTESLDYTIFLIDEDTLDIVHHGPWSWISEGSSVLKRLPGKDHYEAVLNRDMQLRCSAPNRNVRISDVQHS